MRFVRIDKRFKENLLISQSGKGVREGERGNQERSNSFGRSDGNDADDEIDSDLVSYVNARRFVSYSPPRKPACELDDATVEGGTATNGDGPCGLLPSAPILRQWKRLGGATATTQSELVAQYIRAANECHSETVEISKFKAILNYIVHDIGGWDWYVVYTRDRAAALAHLHYPVVINESATGADGADARGGDFPKNTVGAGRRRKNNNVRFEEEADRNGERETKRKRRARDDVISSSSSSSSSSDDDEGDGDGAYVGIFYPGKTFVQYHDAGYGGMSTSKYPIDVIRVLVGGEETEDEKEKGEKKGLSDETRRGERDAHAEGEKQRREVHFGESSGFRGQRDGRKGGDGWRGGFSHDLGTKRMRRIRVKFQVLFRHFRQNKLVPTPLVHRLLRSIEEKREKCGANKKSRAGRACGLCRKDSRRRCCFAGRSGACRDDDGNERLENGWGRGKECGCARERTGESDSIRAGRRREDTGGGAGAAAQPARGILRGGQGEGGQRRCVQCTARHVYRMRRHSRRRKIIEALAPMRPVDVFPPHRSSWIDACRVYFDYL